MEKNSKAAEPPKTEPAALVRVDTLAGFGSTEGFALLQRGAHLLAASTLVPKEYQGNLPNCVIALNMAQRIGADPLMVMQNLYIVHGRPGWSAQFLVATFNQNGRFTAIRYEWVGERGQDGWGCRAWAVEKATSEKLLGATITLGLAKSEGWYGKQGSKWQTMPEQMLMYRSAAWFIRAYAPEIAMGLHTVDELDDIVEMERIGSRSYAAAIVTPDSLLGGTAIGENGVEPGEPPPPAVTVGGEVQAQDDASPGSNAPQRPASADTPLAADGESETVDPHADLLQAIAEVRGGFTPPPKSESWETLTRHFCGVAPTDLALVDPAALTSFLHFLRDVKAKKPEALAEARAIVARRST